MLYSKDRMDLIIEYISAYEAKIKQANIAGLFDNAKLFETFAAEICSLWFGQSFNNLNIIKVNYPYVDLLSDDKKIYVQVSTQQNIPSKIKHTLEKLSESNHKELEEITSPIFFFLNNESAEKVKDLTGKDQIGKYPFTVKDNLITTQTVVERAVTDSDFQQALYALIKSDIDNVNDASSKFEQAVMISQEVGLGNIDETINGTYEINRNALIENIKKDNCQFAVIQGEAGYGKSVLCKKLVQDKDLVLYARADHISECVSLDEIWNIDIVKTFDYLSDRELYIVVDALEYIADRPKSKLDQLQALYAISTSHPNIKIVASCRTCDIRSFIKIINQYCIKRYTVPEISDAELNDISRVFPAIREMRSVPAYADIIRSPFYINEIVRRGVSIESISDINSFREFIWDEVICLATKAKEYDISSKEIRGTIEYIVFERAKNFSCGVRKESIENSLCEFLRSNGVISIEGEYVRLKYDIYEDICFERLFDKAFDECKGDYLKFYDEIDTIGKCVYRRYQIWISNKLISKNNRDRFVFGLIMGNSIPPQWKRNTEIGLVKSTYSKPFFEEQAQNIIDKTLVQEFVDITNLFAYELGDLLQTETFCSMKLKPIGVGRPALIELIYKNGIHKSALGETDSIIKLCADYTDYLKTDIETQKAACCILEYYIENSIQEAICQKSYQFSTNDSQALLGIYKMAKISAEWISAFWARLKEYYSNGNEIESRFSESVIEWTIDHTPMVLVDNKCQELCGLAELLWLTERNSPGVPYPGFIHDFDDDAVYGLSSNARSYHIRKDNVNDHLFLRLLFLRQPKAGLEWAISFVNRAFRTFADKYPNKVSEVELFFVDKNETKKYIGNLNMWLAGIEEYCVPTLLGDIIFLLRNSIISMLENWSEDEELCNYYIKFFVQTIYEKSNNIALLTIIEIVGMHFQKEYPGIAIDLASSIDLLYADLSRYGKYIKNPQKELLERQILDIVGIPDLPIRYPIDEKCGQNLQQYAVDLQIGEETIHSRKCLSIIDYLYSKESIKSDAKSLLQVQKMDLRGATCEYVNDKQIAIVPKLSAETECIVEQQKNLNKPHEKLLNSISKLSDRIANKKVNKDDLLLTISEVEKLMCTPEGKIQYESFLISLIAMALRNEEIDTLERSRLCEIWIDGIEKLMNNESFSSDNKLLPILFEQVEKELVKDTKCHIKSMMLKCILFYEHNGLINKIRQILRKYLETNQALATALFNTIIELSKDEKKHKVYNERYISIHNASLNKLSLNAYGIYNAEQIILESGGEVYESQYDTIIEQFLYNEEAINLAETDTSKCDLSILCMAVNCGIPIENEECKIIISAILNGLIESLKKKDCYRNSALDNRKYVVAEFLKREIVFSAKDSKKAIDIMFDGIDFNDFSDDLIGFYLSVFEDFLCEFYDSYNDSARRQRCKNKLLYLESKVNGITNPYVKAALGKALMLAAPSYYGDWSKCPTEYSYEDKQFLNQQFSKYGGKNGRELVNTIYQMKIDKLLPEILVSVDKCFDELNKSKQLGQIISDKMSIIHAIILKAFLNHSDSIKQLSDLTDAFESVLEMMIKYRDEVAAVILDEFRTH